MAEVDNKLCELYEKILLEGEVRGNTRTGETIALWDEKIVLDLSKEFPAVTNKKLAWRAIVGELLFFLSGEGSLYDLRHYTFGDMFSSKWTIWDDDCERWHSGEINHVDGKNLSAIEVGKLYPHQWRNFGGGYCIHGDDDCGVDQIKNLIERLVSDSQRRDLIVMAWNPYDIENDLTALKACHTGFQCYVNNSNELSLKVGIRSSDALLGLPFNIVSYALLTHLLAGWADLKVGKLTIDIGDAHIYANHIDEVREFMRRDSHDAPKLVLPEQAKLGLDELLKLTALDFKDSLQGYKHSGVLKAPLSVGD